MATPRCEQPADGASGENRPNEEIHWALAIINQTPADVIATGLISEEEVERVFDLTRPWPDPSRNDRDDQRLREPGGEQ